MSNKTVKFDTTFVYRQAKKQLNNVKHKPSIHAGGWQKKKERNRK